MDQKTQQLIEQLATKLGTTAEHLWGVLVKQAPINSTCELITHTIVCASMVWLTCFLFRKRKNETREGNKWDDLSPTGWWTVAMVASGIATLVVVLWAASDIGLITSGFCNPEYWALKQLI